MSTGGPSLRTLSVVVPAHDEARLIGRCLDAVALAAARTPVRVEVVVVANRCRDATAAVAADAGATVVESGARNLAVVRNLGIEASAGDVVVTVDADCRLHPDSLRLALGLLASGRFVGGGTRVVPERRSTGIDATYALVGAMTFVTGLSGGSFWSTRSDLDAVGGFDTSVLVAEDLDLARRLRTHGRRTGRRWGTIRTAPVEASCRKFDRYGDWHMFAMGRELRSIAAARRGTDTSWVDRYFFDFQDVVD